MFTYRFSSKHKTILIWFLTIIFIYVYDDTQMLFVYYNYINNGKSDYNVVFK